MKIFFASFFICLVLICGVMLLGALFGGFGLLLLAVLALAGLIGGFTLYPPQGLLFRDLSAVGSWLPLPC